ncbi:thrombospondin type 3 repeat-containing protein [Pontibacter ummariensis]|uniref:Thrombospondin type 3 repeat-containing protein n=1 Tax=Pontibacter ummariensis TaxID=1610492 RepID=A0A239DXJ1_9BACT|nr:OmpA family protein [Pontibacter ummariensis]PRY13735.1 thrombospondin type 3 repeat-containing protein [Pontibacter ummariensis]SNS36433.1 Thrombospondin type 3 repeat-containing protein [Pontibacter ummariensis]
MKKRIRSTPYLLFLLVILTMLGVTACRNSDSPSATEAIQETGVRELPDGQQVTKEGSSIVATQDTTAHETADKEIQNDAWGFLTDTTDSDNDGVLNFKDLCPEDAGGGKYGCPDTDGDGLIDIWDVCPIVAGLSEREGCPEPDEETKRLIEEKVRIEFEQDLLQEPYKILLDSLAVEMIHSSDFGLIIQGGAEQVDSVVYNLALSNARAQKVKDYLVQQGVDDSLITIYGTPQYIERELVYGNTKYNKYDGPMKRRVSFYFWNNTLDPVDEYYGGLTEEELSFGFGEEDAWGEGLGFGDDTDSNVDISIEEEISVPPSKQEPNIYKIEKGNLAHFVPSPMKVDSTVLVSLVISKGLPVDKLIKSLTNTTTFKVNPDTSRLIVKKGIEVSRQMKARFFAVDGAAFRIKLQSEEIQQVELGHAAETKWVWSVTPLKAGKHNLIMKASIMFYDFGEKVWREFDVYDGVVPVVAVEGTNMVAGIDNLKLAPGSNATTITEPEKEPSKWKKFSVFMKDNWEWIAGVLAMIGGAATWTYSTFFKQKEPAPEVNQPRVRRRKVI